MRREVFAEEGGPMGSKMVVDKKKSAEAVISAGRTYRDDMASWFGDLFGSDAAPAVSLIIDKAISSLGSSTEAMLAADIANLNEPEIPPQGHFGF